MNIVERLKEHVISSVYGQTPPSQKEHNAIHDYISVFLASIAAKQDLGELKSAHSPEDLISRIFPGSDVRTRLFDKLSDEHGIEKDRLHEIIHRVTPETALGLEKLAQSENRTVPEFLRHYAAEIGTRLPRWTLALLPAGVLAALGLREGAQTAAPRAAADNTHRPINNTPAKKKSIWPWIILVLIILALLAFFGLNKTKHEETPQPEAATTADADANDSSAEKPMSLKLITNDDGGIKQCTGEAPSDDIKKTLPDCDITVNDKIAKSSADSQKFAELLTLIAQSPDAYLELNGDKATINVKDQAAAEKAEALAKEALPGYELKVKSKADGKDEHKDLAEHQNDDAQGAADSSDRSEVKLGDDGKVEFYFATNETKVAKGAEDKVKDIIDAAKEGKTITITGYTDSTGSAQVNEKVSKERAKSVKAFLIMQGVPEDKIELVKPETTEIAPGKNQEGRRVDVSIKQ